MKTENYTPVTASPIPEFLRVADAVRMFSIGKSTLADWIARGWIKSVLVSRPGNKSGCRLISTESLRGFIWSHAESGNSQNQEAGK